MTSKFFAKFLKIYFAYGRMLIPASIIYPVGNLIGSFISCGGVRLSLQWINVSSRSNTIHFLSVLN
jgi:hypothetical protein